MNTKKRKGGMPIAIICPHCKKVCRGLIFDCYDKKGKKKLPKGILFGVKTIKGSYPNKEANQMNITKGDVITILICFFLVYCGAFHIINTLGIETYYAIGFFIVGLIWLAIYTLSKLEGIINEQRKKRRI